VSSPSNPKTWDIGQSALVLLKGIFHVLKEDESFFRLFAKKCQRMFGLARPVDHGAPGTI
jgi:hypothetical protein